MAITNTTAPKSLAAYAKPTNPVDELPADVRQEIIDGHAQGIGAARIRSWLHDEYHVNVSMAQVRRFLDGVQRGQS